MTALWMSSNTTVPQIKPVQVVVRTFTDNHKAMLQPSGQHTNMHTIAVSSNVQQTWESKLWDTLKCKISSALWNRRQNILLRRNTHCPFLITVENALSNNVYSNTASLPSQPVGTERDATNGHLVQNTCYQNTIEVRMLHINETCLHVHICTVIASPQSSSKDGRATDSCFALIGAHQHGVLMVDGWMTGCFCNHLNTCGFNRNRQGRLQSSQLKRCWKGQLLLQLATAMWLPVITLSIYCIACLFSVETTSV